MSHMLFFSQSDNPRLTPLSEHGNAKLIASSGGKFPLAIAADGKSGDHAAFTHTYMRRVYVYIEAVACTCIAGQFNILIGPAAHVATRLFVCMCCA
jgi:hypothetical protein